MQSGMEFVGNLMLALDSSPKPIHFLKRTIQDFSEMLQLLTITINGLVELLLANL